MNVGVPIVRQNVCVLGLPFKGGPVWIHLPDNRCPRRQEQGLPSADPFFPRYGLARFHRVKRLPEVHHEYAPTLPTTRINADSGPFGGNVTVNGLAVMP